MLQIFCAFEMVKNKKMKNIKLAIYDFFNFKMAEKKSFWNL